MVEPQTYPFGAPLQLTTDSIGVVIWLHSLYTFPEQQPAEVGPLLSAGMPPQTPADAVTHSPQIVSQVPASQLPHEPPQPSLPHWRPVQSGTQLPAARLGQPPSAGTPTTVGPLQLYQRFPVSHWHVPATPSVSYDPQLTVTSDPLLHHSSVVPVQHPVWLTLPQGAADALRGATAAEPIQTETTASTQRAGADRSMPDQRRQSHLVAGERGTPRIRCGMVPLSALGRGSLGPLTGSRLESRCSTGSTSSTRRSSERDVNRVILATNRGQTATRRAAPRERLAGQTHRITSGKRWVADGDRTHNTRSHSPVLYR